MTFTLRAINETARRGGPVSGPPGRAASPAGWAKPFTLVERTRRRQARVALPADLVAVEFPGRPAAFVGWSIDYVFEHAGQIELEFHARLRDDSFPVGGLALRPGDVHRARRVPPAAELVLRIADLFEVDTAPAGRPDAGRPAFGLTDVRLPTPENWRTQTVLAIGGAPADEAEGDWRQAGRRFQQARLGARTSASLAPYVADAFEAQLALVEEQIQRALRAEEARQAHRALLEGQLREWRPTVEAEGVMSPAPYNPLFNEVAELLVPVVPLLLGLVPILGTIIDVVEVATGRDFFTDEELRGFERDLSVLSIMLDVLPVVGRVASTSAEAVSRISRRLLVPADTVMGGLRALSEIGDREARQAARAIADLQAGRRLDAGQLRVLLGYVRRLRKLSRAAPATEAAGAADSAARSGRGQPSGGQGARGRRTAGAARVLPVSEVERLTHLFGGPNPVRLDGHDHHVLADGTVWRCSNLCELRTEAVEGTLGRHWHTRRFKRPIRLAGAIVAVYARARRHRLDSATVLSWMRQARENFRRAGRRASGTVSSGAGREGGLRPLTSNVDFFELLFRLLRRPDIGEQQVRTILKELGHGHSARHVGVLWVVRFLDATPAVWTSVRLEIRSAHRRIDLILDGTYKIEFKNWYTWHAGSERDLARQVLRDLRNFDPAHLFYLFSGRINVGEAELQRLFEAAVDRMIAELERHGATRGGGFYESGLDRDLLADRALILNRWRNLKTSLSSRVRAIGSFEELTADVAREARAPQ